jgi:hypothetical protein
VARALNRLTVREVASLKEPGRHADGGGLYLRISPSGARSWGFMYVVAGKRTELGLGSVASLPLATARRVASEMREALAVGNDPKKVLAPVVEPLTEQPKVITFGEFAEGYISGVEDGWKSDVHRKQWRSSLREQPPLGGPGR